MSTIIIFASKYGCTEKCAKLLASKLNGKVELHNLKTKNKIDLSKYDHVIIGGSIYVGKIRKEVTEFCTKYLSELKQKTIGLFICGMQEDNIETEINTNFPQELLKIAKGKEYFGGEFSFEKMNFFEKLIIKNITKVTESKSNINEVNIQRLANAMK